jgi:hypothetical protein
VGISKYTEAARAEDGNTTKRVLATGCVDDIMNVRFHVMLGMTRRERAKTA